MSLLNLTPHTIKVMTHYGELYEFEPCGTVARVSTTSKVLSQDVCPGFVVNVTEYGNVEGIPEAGTEQFLVSAMVLDRLGSEYSGWAFAPDTGPSAVRNDKGHVDYVVQLKTVPQPF